LYEPSFYLYQQQSPESLAETVGLDALLFQDVYRALDIHWLGDRLRRPPTLWTIGLLAPPHAPIVPLYSTASKRLQNIRNPNYWGSSI
jgi:hypothetical protein